MYQEMLRRSQEPLLIVISGPSGVGKDAVVKRMKARGLPFHFVVTAASRKPRPGEVHGVDYFFLSEAEFQTMLENNELLEHAMVYNAHKGIPKEQVRQALASGKDVVMRIDVQGARTIRSIVPDAVLIFLATRSEDELIQRLRARRTESAEDFQLRIHSARHEMQQAGIFDYYVVNAEGQLDATVDTIKAIIEAEHCRTQPRKVEL